MDLDTARRWWRALSEKQRTFIVIVLQARALPETIKASDSFVFYAYTARHWPTQDGWPK